MEYTSGLEPCHARLVGRLFNQFGYGLAFQKNSPYTDIFSMEILKLRQENFMSLLYQKWFSGICIEGDCN